jgi:hypothetical protein
MISYTSTLSYYLEILPNGLLILFCIIPNIKSINKKLTPTKLRSNVLEDLTLTPFMYIYIFHIPPGY